MRAFDGRSVAILEGRKSSELAAMVHRLGGVAICAPAVRERPVDGAVPVVERVIDGSFDIAVVLTGAGASALLDEAGRVGSLRDVVLAMKAMTIACRGPKPLSVLRRHGILPDIVTARPHTSKELLEALRSTDLDGTTLMLLHYGERNAPLSSALAARGAI